MKRRKIQVASLCVLAMASASYPLSASADKGYDANGGESSVMQQNGKTLKGIVKDTSGEAVIGASIVIKGTQTGTITDLDGGFTLNNVKPGSIIQVSFVGYQTQEVKWNGSPLSVVLKDDSKLMDEVVVTALGMKRETKALGYAVTEVKGDEMRMANTISPVASLQGKVAGVEIAQSDGGIFGATKIQIRGASTLSGNDQPIYVVDGVILDNATSGNTDLNWGTNANDYGNALKNLNPDDFESVSVLKGAAATALYGSRALNGAVVITTKSGKGGKKGIGVTLSQTLGWDVIIDHPEVQYEYGYGLWVGELSSYGNRWQNHGTTLHPNEQGKATMMLNSDGVATYKGAAYSSYGWGARFDGSPIENYDGTMTTYNACKNGMDSFYQTGFNTNTNVTISGANDRSSFYTSLSYKHNRGQMVNNTFDRYSMLLKGTHKITDKLDVAASMSFAYSKPRNATPEVGLYWVYSGIPNWIDAGYWKDKYKGDHGGMASNNYGDAYGYVPGNIKNVWWNAQENDYAQREFVWRPTFEINYHILDWLTAKADGNMNYYTNNSETKSLGNGYAMEGGYYGLGSSSTVQLTLGGQVNANKKIGDFQVGGFGRFEYYSKRVQSNSVSTSGGFIVPGQFFIGNSKNTAGYYGAISGTKRMMSAIFAMNASWKDQLFMDVTGRNDWSSTLLYADGRGNYSYFYPSVSGSWLVTESLKDVLPSWISFAKLRASWAQVGNDMGEYAINTGYNVGSIKTTNGMIYTNGFSSNSIYDQNLKPERKTSYEFGLDFRVLKNRIGLDFTYYKENTRDQILAVGVPGISGIGSKTINAGNIQNSGIEVALNTTPIQTKDFSWDLNFTYTRNRNKIISLSEEASAYIPLQGQVNAYDFRIGSVAEVGGAYGLLKSDIMPARDEKGNVLLTWDDYDRIGYAKRSNELQTIGSLTPDFLGSVSSTFAYKNWSLHVALDCRFGGYVASYANRYGLTTGKTGNSLKYRDENSGGLTFTSKWMNNDGTPSDSYGITYHDGVIPEGVFAANTSVACADGVTRDLGGLSYAECVEKGYLEPAHAGAYWYYMNDWGAGVINDTWVQKLNYIALREITLGYRLPKNWAAYVGAQNVNCSFTARNLGYLYNSLNNNVNPEGVRGNNSGEFRIRTYNPYTANLMFTVNVEF